MALAAKIWTPISIHQVLLSWLRAERNKPDAAYWTALKLDVGTLAALLDRANLHDAEENRVRLQMLYLIRDRYFHEIPPDTEWYEVSNLTDEDLGELHVVNHGAWTHADDRNELTQVAARTQFTLDKPPHEWERPILFGHSKAGPFAILEGNHRLAAYARSGRQDLNIPVMIGLSPMRCLWNIHDGNDGIMWQFR